MRKLRESLTRLFHDTWQSDRLPGRVRAMILQEAMQLLSEDAKAQLGVTCRLLSHGRYHRYIMVVHCPDQAFYPDAIRTYLHKIDVHPVQQQSTIFSIKHLSDIEVSPEIDKHHNSLFLVYHFSAATTEGIEQITKDVKNILSGVHLSVSDFPLMRGDLDRIAIYLSEDQPEEAELLQWMIDDNYLFFGLEYLGVSGKNRGICRNKRVLEKLMPGFQRDLTAIAEAESPGIDWLNLPATFSHLYSTTNVKAVRISWLENDKLKTAVLIGYFSRSARYINASYLPCLNRVWQDLAKDISLLQSAFYQREVRMLFDRTPKSLLHSISANQWLEPYKKVVNMNNPTQVVVSRLTPEFGDAEYLLIAVEKHRFGNNIWRNMQRALLKLKFQLLGSESYAVGSIQLIFVALKSDGWPPMEFIENALTPCVVFWKDRARQKLLSAGLPAKLLHESLLELSNISNLYQDQFSPEQFVSDLLAREKLKSEQMTQVRVDLHQQESRQLVEVQILMAEELPLGVMTAKLNAFALITMEQSLTPFHDAEQQMYICRFQCQAPEQLHPEGLPRLQEGIEDVFNDLAPNDPLNALLVLCGLNIRDVMVLITLRNHLVQMMSDVSKDSLTEVMIRQTKVSKSLFRLFEGKHRPAMPTTFLEKARLDFKKAMVDVQVLKEDKWLNALAEIVLASLRSNAWQRDKSQAMAIKIDSSKLSFAPKPRPYREVFVNGVNVEGVHLRAGPVARGGLRFSDRPTDYRTEVLELMATQVVKNGQIVPTGAKGGFVVRNGSGPEFVLKQYHQFIRALLSLTDNRVQGKTVPCLNMNIPKQDEGDTYLVVAADKGTARFSDDANAESLKSGFWLGDAFASGGSHGYDHKAFGITAKGAWVCAAHHFSRFERNLWHNEATAVGIGDMGGDVFGNGMLLNPNLKLVAAFNHVHIFLDPEPDVTASYIERKRLFEEVKGWGSYDKSLISEGGGVFDRGAKSIGLSEAVQKVLGISEKSCSGEELIQAILRAPVDILYNGGIGTYVKASSESDAHAQDPSNNAVRVNADTLRCKVVCEGGNLGFTKASRIEFALRGGVINTDAIDNAAGVNMSDHEVNLKILLSHVPFSQRNRLLKHCGDAVSEQCLNDNHEQAVALSLTEISSEKHLPRLRYLQQHLLEQGYLSKLEGDEKRLTLRPVFAEWLGHEKNRVHQALDDEGFRQNSLFGDPFLIHYFPSRLRKKFREEILNHPLADDIAHTRITSHVLNRYGLTSVYFLQNITAKSVSEVVQALLIAEFLLDTDKVYQQLLNQTAIDLDGWYDMQQQVLEFAEGLLVLDVSMALDLIQLKRIRKTMQQYAEQHGMQLSEMAMLVTATSLAEAEGASLHRCLDVTKLSLDALPFAKLEQVLHSPLWSGADAHALRCEWLANLAKMKVQAGRQLLNAKAGDREKVVRRWLEHPVYQKLKSLLAPKFGQSKEEERLQYILAITHLRNVIQMCS